MGKNVEYMYKMEHYSVLNKEEILAVYKLEES